MKSNYKLTFVGEWLQGIVKLKDANFSKEDAIELHEKVSDLLTRVIETLDVEHPDFPDILKAIVNESFEGIVHLKQNGLSMEEINNVLDTMSDALYNAEIYYNEDDEFEDLDFEDEDFEDEDFEDDEFDYDEFEDDKDNWKDELPKITSGKKKK